MDSYQSTSGRINRVKGEILKHAVPVEVLAMGCTMKKMPKNAGDNIEYRRWLPFGATSASINSQNRPAAVAAAHIIQEGVTPKADTLTPVDVNVKQQQYACLYSYTDKAAELHEDDIPEAQKIEVGERMGLVREMVRFGAMRAATNVIYQGGVSRGSVNAKISLNSIRKMVRTLEANHAKKKTRILAPTPNWGTSSVEAGYIVFVHTDAAPDIRNLPGFTTVADYGSRQPLSDRELGSCEEFRFITSPELHSYQSSGANGAAAANNYTSGGDNADVYPFIVCGEEAVFDVAIRGMSSFSVEHIPHTHKDKADLLGQRGYVGCKFWSAVKVVNGGWMGLIEAAVSDLA